MNISKELSKPTVILHSDKYYWGASKLGLPENVVDRSLVWYVGRATDLSLSSAVEGDTVQVNSSSWKISRRSLVPGNYFIKIISRVVFGNESSSYETITLYDYGYMKILSTPLVARIKGGSSILWGFNENVTANGSLSYDPDVGLWNYKGLKFSWSCRRAESLNFTKDCFGAFERVESREIVSDTSRLTVNASYVIRLIVSDGSRNTTDEQIVTVIKGPFPRVEIR